MPEGTCAHHPGDTAAQLAAVFAASRDAILVVDRHGIVETVNGAAESLFGYPADRMAGQPLDMLVPPESGMDHGPTLAARIAAGEGAARAMDGGRDVTALAADGTRLPISVTVVRFDGNDGPRFVGTVRDRRGETDALAGWRDSAARLDRNETLMRTMIHASPLGVAVSRRDGEILVANQRLAEIGHTTPEALIGTNARDFYADPADRDALIAELRRHGVVRDREVRYRRMDGEVFWGLVSLMPTVYEGVEGIIIWLYDISGHYQALLDVVPAEVALLNGQGAIVTVNAAWRASDELNGRPGDSAMGTNYVAVCREAGGAGTSDVGLAADGIEAILNGSRDEFSLVYQCPVAAEERWFKMLVRPVSGALGARVAVMHVNVTDQVRVEKDLRAATNQAEQANRAKSAFLAGMSHELRTPLNAIIGYSRLAGESAEDCNDDDLAGDLGHIEGSAKHLLEMINDIMDLSKIEAGRMDVRREAVDVRGLLDEVSGVAEPLARANNNRFRAHVVSDPGPLVSDQLKIRQSLLNLVSNACKFTSDGHILLSAQREAAGGRAWAVFTVADSGIGMTEEQLGRIFQDYTQADRSTSRQYGGTGLGLSLTRQFCDMLGGRLDVTSTPGEGTRFTLRLPTGQPAPDTLPACQGSGWRGPVLVVDDDAADRQAMREALEAADYRTLEASDGETALRTTREAKPGAVVLDLFLPGRDGWDVLAALKNDPDLCHIPVVVATILESGGQSATLGATDMLPKPVRPERLVSVVDRQCAGRANPHVLYVDDDAASRDLVRRTLEQGGYSVATAADGRAALERLGRLRPDLLLVDLIMPGLSGFSVIEAVRADPALADIPVVVLTARDLSPEEESWLAEHGGPVMQKGAYCPESVVALVRDACAQGGAS